MYRHHSPGADLVEELLPVLALGPLVRAGDINHVGGCGWVGVHISNYVTKN